MWRFPSTHPSEGFHLVTRIQDEAHRFAIEYHRSLRSKEQVHSVLDDIPGIGETRRKALMRRFRSVENIRDASVEELSQTESMNMQSAESVYAFFTRFNIEVIRRIVYNRKECGFPSKHQIKRR